MKHFAGIVAVLLSVLISLEAQGELLGYWSFDDASDTMTALDSTTNGNHGQILGPAVYTGNGGGHTGMAGDYAMDFGASNDARIVLPGNTWDSITANNEVSISLWIFGDLSQPGNDTVFSWAEGGTRKLAAHLPWSNSIIYWDVGGCCGPSTRTEVPATPSMFEGRWNHYVFVKEGTAGASSRIYFNSSLIASQNTSSVIGTIDNAVIGAETPDGGNSYAGLIDDFAIFDHALSDQTIEGLYAKRLTPLTVSERIIYVDDDAPGDDDGTSWADAYNYLQDALADANSGDEPVEIRVGKGIYKPDLGVGITLRDRTATFQLVNRVAIRGGYAGFGEPDPNARNIDLYETILSGDLNGDDDPDDPSYEVDNSDYVASGILVDGTSVLDGLTITGGSDDGAGMDNYGGSPTLTNCTFRENSGAGMENTRGSPTLTNCTFRKNFASGMQNYGSSATLTNCMFSENYGFVGGGMYNDESSPKLTNCTFLSNLAYNGSGMCNYPFSSPTLTNCTFSNNIATHFGGGMFNNYYSNPTLINCTFEGNHARYGSGISNYWNSIPTLTNCILWNFVFEIDFTPGEPPIVNYSNIRGGWPGVGNIGADPCFADHLGGDYHLKSQAGRWDANEGRWVKDDVTSPCIDAGDPNTGWTAELWPHGGRINMGAYGGTSEASMSQVCGGNTNVADLNNDGSLDFGDAAILSDMWLTVGPVAGDIDLSGSVDSRDFAGFARYWPDGGCSEQTLVAYDGDYSVDVRSSEFVEVNLFEPAVGVCISEVRLSVSINAVDFGATFDNESVAALSAFNVAALLRLRRGQTELATFEGGRAVSTTIGGDDELFPIGIPDFEGTDTIVLTDTLQADDMTKALSPGDYIGSGTVQLQLTYEVWANSSLPSVHSRIDNLGPATGHLRVEYVYCER